MTIGSLTATVFLPRRGRKIENRYSSAREEIGGQAEVAWS